MALSKSVTLANGTVADYWAVQSMQYVVKTGVWNVYLGGYLTEASYTSGSDPLLTRFFSVTATALGITALTSTLTANEAAVYTAILAVVTANTSDALYGATSA